MERCSRNVIGLALVTVLAAVVFITTPTPSLASAIPILTYHYNNTRTGANTSETLLTPLNVNVSHFGKLFSLPVDDSIYTQPLYVPGLTIAGKVHNVVYVATRNNSVYAFDADNGAKLWSKNLGPTQPPPQNCSAFGNVGIFGTPVITANSIYLVAATLRKGLSARQELHALNISTGAEQPHSPAVITASVPGTGRGSVGGRLTFNPRTEFQRPALLSDNGSIYVGFAAYCDYAPDSAIGHGWIFAYNASTLTFESNFVVTPNGIGGGIWASGGGPAADSNHNIYFSTGDGTFDVNSGGVDYGDSVLKLSSGSLALRDYFTGSRPGVLQNAAVASGSPSASDYFTPSNQAYLEDNALDLGSGGVLLMPHQSTTPHNLLVTAGKYNLIYVINRDNLGHYTMSQVVQKNFNIKGLFSTPTFWNNRLYFAGTDYTGDDSPKVFPVSGGRMSTDPTSRAGIYPYPGAVTVVSANGANNGILWALQHGGTSSGNDVLHAYNALNLTNQLYNSDQAGSRDLPGVVGNQFESIIVDNGKVYVPSTGQHQLSIYGLLP